MSNRRDDQNNRRRRPRDTDGRTLPDRAGRSPADDHSDLLETSMDFLENASHEWLNIRTALQGQTDCDDDDSFDADELYGLDAFDVADTLTGIDTDTLTGLETESGGQEQKPAAPSRSHAEPDEHSVSVVKPHGQRRSKPAGGVNVRRAKSSTTTDEQSARGIRPAPQLDFASGQTADSRVKLRGSDSRPNRPAQRAAIVRPAWWVMNLSLLCVLQAVCLAMGLFTAPTIPAGSLVNGVTSLSLPWMPALSVEALKTFAWVTALQGGLCYLVFNRIYHQYRQRESRIESRFRRQQRALLKTRDAMIVGLTRLAESRDNDTQGHLDRVGRYSAMLARAAALRPEYSDQITDRFINLIEISAALHDIGKAGISDSILLKPGRLTDDERRRMQAHTRISSDCLRRIERCLGNSNFLAMAHDIALFHHEWWNGAGYPSGISGEQIPLSARIVAIADVYDALSARRVYKEPYAHEDCLKMIVASSGQQFDPTLVEVLQEVEAGFREIAAQYPDTDPVPKSVKQPDLVRDCEPARNMADISKGSASNPVGKDRLRIRARSDAKPDTLPNKHRPAWQENSWDHSVDSVEIDVDEILQIVSPRPRPDKDEARLDRSAAGNRSSAE